MILLELFTSLAWPCGGLFHGDEQLLESDASETILELVDEGVAVTYRVEFEGDAADFGWVIPISDEFVSIIDAEESRFTELRDASQPTVNYPASRGGGGCACGPASKGDGMPGSDNGDVQVVAEGFTGSYDYIVIEGNDPDAVVTWLEDNGWSVGASSPSITAYADENFQFVCLSIGDVDLDDRQSLPPVQITYSGDDLIYPSRMARYAQEEEQKTIIYVVGDQAAEASGWSDENVGDIQGEEGDDPNELYDDALRSLGEETSFGLVYAGEYGNDWLTRFETRAPPSVHTIDAEFTLSGGTVSAETTINVSGSSDSWLIFPLLGLGGWALRRRRFLNG